MKTVSEIRSEFLGYFAGKGHEVVPSSPLVPQNDPTLMFVNAGMVQFKDVFTGKEKRAYTRAATAQKCVRAGGKHNDLDNVGYTARHHTFFEMLGNFSFGDYFKDDAIAMAWELVTKNFGLSPEKLLVTVHSSDEEAAKIWAKVTGFPDSKIIRIPTSDNFWAMGDTGPCGPCTEIFYDHGEGIPGGPPGSADADGDRFIEIWNNVFMQFEQVDKDTRINLPAPSVDTGMGLERIAAILQGKHNNYDIDLLRRIIEHSADLTGISPDGEQAASHRVIADHLRCSAFLLADGVMPSNEGRGYVLRRIMRRGMRHAHLLQQPIIGGKLERALKENDSIQHVKVLKGNSDEPLMYKLVPTLISMMGEAYPELRRAESLITETLKAEETRFAKTLAHGLKLLDEETENLPAGKKFSGEAAFKLYDTFGFPVDLTQDALRAKGIAVDMAGFDAAMAAQKAQARASWSGSGDTATEKLWFELLEECGPTEFLGYETERVEGKILAIIKNGKKIETAQEGDVVQIIMNQSPFYAESGGQVGDAGVMQISERNFNVCDVLDTKKKAGKLWVHECQIFSGHLSVDKAVIMIVDHDRRAAIRANHSATHLLHAALRERLGAHVTQKGSVVDDKRLRFDISHQKGLSAEDIAAVEETVNREIRANTPVSTRLMAQEEAIEAGAMALFGEKYDSEVRVLTMGTQKASEKPFSVELCGGTHAKRTGDIGLFKIVSEGALAAGIRRIEAMTGIGAFHYLEEQDRKVRELAEAVKSTPADVVERVKALADEKKKLEQQVVDLRRQMAAGGGGNAAASAHVKQNTAKGFTVYCDSVDLPANELKALADQIMAQGKYGVIVLGSKADDKASVVVSVSSAQSSDYNASDLVRKASEILGGKGGGRPDMAQGGGPLVDKLEDALNVIVEVSVSG